MKFKLEMILLQDDGVWSKDTTWELNHQLHKMFDHSELGRVEEPSERMEGNTAKKKSRSEGACPTFDWPVCSSRCFSSHHVVLSVVVELAKDSWTRLICK